MNEQEFINYSIGMKYSLSNREKSEIDENDFYYWNNGAFLYTAESKDKNTEIYFANAGNDKCLPKKLMEFGNAKLYDVSSAVALFYPITKEIQDAENAKWIKDLISNGFKQIIGVDDTGVFDKRVRKYKDKNGNQFWIEIDEGSEMEITYLNYNKEKLKIIEGLKYKYKYIEAVLVGTESFDDFGENDCLVFKNSHNEKLYFWSYLEDEEFELMDDYDEVISKYKNKPFHVFYRTEERDIGSTEIELKPVKVIHKLIQ